MSWFALRASGFGNGNGAFKSALIKHITEVFDKAAARDNLNKQLEAPEDNN
ncbi:MAG: hypothetical protein KME29_05130 [Calothrix sp. FI2-JRJ7]|nr:hypothetical protein [Calothrix sp. FI2-JRJ7]